VSNVQFLHVYHRFLRLD